MNRFASFIRLAVVIPALLALTFPLTADNGKRHKDPHRWDGTINGAITGASPEGVITVAFTGQGTQVGDFIGGGAHTFSSPLDFEGTSNLVADNGDKLFLHYEASFDPDVDEPPFPYDGTLTVLGGTGKFRNAKGQAELTAELRADHTFTIHFKGRLVLTGSGHDDD